MFNPGDHVKYIGPHSNRFIWGEHGIYTPGIIIREACANDYWVKFQNGQERSCARRNLELMTEDECILFIDNYCPELSVDLKIPALKDLL